MKMSRFARPLFYAGVMLAVGLIAQSAFDVLRYRDAFPYYDLILVDYRYFTPPFRDFWIFRDNEHLPLVAMPFFWADLRLFGGQGLFLVLCNLVFALAVAAAPFGAVFRATRDRAAAYAACGLMALSMLWLVNRTNLSWPKQTHMYLSLFAMVFAFRRVASNRPVRLVDALGICASLAVATFSFGYGIIGFVPVLLLAIQRKWRPFALLSIPVAFVACLFLYSRISGSVGYGIQAYAGEASPLLHEAGLFVLYALTFVAAPIVDTCQAFLSCDNALLLGRIAAVAAIAVVAWRTLLGFRRPPDELDAWALLLAIFTLGNAAETSLARAARFGMQGALEYRYVVGELPLWIAMVLLLVRFLRSSKPQAKLPAAMLLITIELGLLLSQQYELGNLRYASAVRWQAAMSALDGVPDRKLYDSSIWPPSADQVIAVIAGLKTHHWSVFGWKQADWLGRDIGRFGPAVSECTGRLERIAPVPDGNGVEVDGWVLDRHVSPGWGWVVITGVAGKVVGVAHAGVPREDLLARHPGDPVLFAGWRGYVAGTPALADLTAWLVLPSRAVCRLGQPTALQS